MTDNRAYVIVGASLAGAKAAQALREEGFDGTLILIGEESERPYELPGVPLGRVDVDLLPCVLAHQVAL